MKKLISLALVAVLAFALCLVGCDTTTGGGKVADNTEHLTEVTNTCKLTKSYEDKSFLSDGIGEATVVRFTDGDTFTVRLKKDEQSVTIRFHSVDTPETTGSIEKWGKAASLFVEQQLRQAQIVIEATAVPAEHDSYGVRYLGYVWYRTSETEDFKNLNLELVENGYSRNKGNDGAKFPYNNYFKKAEASAKNIKLRVWSDLEDPYYSTDPTATTLKELITDTDKFYNSDIDSGIKVSFDACLTAVEYYKGSSGTTVTFTASAYDEETGKIYSIPVYVGYAGKTVTTMKLGHLYTIVGSLQNHYGTMQISGVMYNPILDGGADYTKVIRKDYYLTFGSSVEYNVNYYDTLYTDVTIVSSTLNDGVLTIVGNANRRKQDGFYEEVSTYTFKVKVAEDTDVSKYSVGKTFSVKGYQFEEDSKIIDILKLSDIVLK